MAVKIVLVLVIIACFVAAVLVTADRPAGPAKYLGYWRAADQTQTGGPLLISISETTEGIQIDGLPELSGYFTPVEADADELVVEAQPAELGQVRVRFTPDRDGEAMMCSFAAEDGQGPAPALKSIEFERAQGSEDQLRTELEAQIAERNKPPEQRISEGAEAIQQAIEAWADANDGRYPPLQMVGVGTPLADTIEGGWPTNPSSGAPMQMSASPGDFSYQTDGRTYRLVVNMPDGSQLTLP